jgi:hypothetical protein
MEMAEILQRHEGKTLEFKRDLSSPDKVLHTLIAFANTAGACSPSASKTAPSACAGWRIR